MKSKFIQMILITLSTLTLAACQTPNLNSNLTKQTGQIIDMSLATVSVDSDGDGIADELDACPNTNIQHVVDHRGCHITTGLDTSLKMEYRAFFEKEGSSELLFQYRKQLDEVAIIMREHDTATMRVEGNMSESEINNSTLAKSRAMIVKNYMIMQQKITPERITTFNCGVRNPIAPNDTKEGRHMNRRVYGIVTRPEEQEVNYFQNDLNTNPCIEFK